MDIASLMDRAVKHALHSIAGAEGPLIPFTFVLDAHPDPARRTLVLTRYAAEYLEQALQQARDSIKPNRKASMYAIAWDGFATVDGRKWDAVLVEGGVADVEEGAIIAQRYELRTHGILSRRRRHAAVGKPIRIGSTVSRLWWTG